MFVYARVGRVKLPERSQSPVEVVADGLDDSGRGTATWQGRRLAVADLLPGEGAEVEIEHVSPGNARAWARVARRLGPPSPDRARPACPAFGLCGGCVWQHLDYAAQLVRKRERVVRAMADAGVELAVREVVPSPRVLGYRNKGKYVFGPGPVLGAYQPRSHEIVDTLGCQVVEPAIDRAARALRDAAASSELSPYDEATGRGELRYAVIRRGGDGRVLVALVVTSATPRAPLARLARTLVDGGAATGVAVLDNDSAGNAILGAGDAVLLAGDGGVGERVAGVAIELDATAFWQIHRDQAAAIYQAIAEGVAAGPDTVAVDLYCGVGGIALALAARGARVTGVERLAAAVRAAEATATRAGLADRLRFVTGDAADLASLGRGADTVVVNPPRKGLDAATRRALVDLAPARVAYLSCGPASLARDLAELLAAGYRADPITPFDLMPGTPQIESLVVLRR